MKVTHLKARAAAAWTRRHRYDAMLRDVYDYVLPYRDVSGLHLGTTGQAEAAKRVDKVFDATAVKAAFRFAGRIQTDVTPLFQDFFKLEAGPLVPAGDDRKQLTEEFEAVAATVNGVLASSSYHNASHEAYTDLYAGTCHMLVNKGDDGNLVTVMAVPVPEVAIEEGPDGQVEGWYWKKKYLVTDLPVKWPRAKFPKTIEDRLKAAGWIVDNGKWSHAKDYDENEAYTLETGDTEIWQYTYKDRTAGGYRLCVWCVSSTDKDKLIHEETFRTSPWITCRFFKLPGEPYGRGPSQLAMPFIKTANMTRELQLKAAAFALMGLFAYRNDGVFNPANVKFEPRAMWPVASTGGPMGPTLQRLDIPKDFDISGIVMADEREQMKQALFDDTLPPDAGAVRSATEVAERISRLSQDLAGVYGRLTFELVVPLVARVIDILEQSKLLKTSLKIDQLLARVRVVAPIAAQQQASKVKAVATWGDLVTALAGPGSFKRYAKADELLPETGRWLGIEERFIRSSAEIKAEDEAEKKMVEQQHAAEVASKMPPPPSPQQQAMNGGMM